MTNRLARVLVGFTSVVWIAAGCGKGSGGGGGGGSLCSVATDCSGGQVCVAGTCRKPGAGGMGSPCSATRDCGGGLACDGLTGKCLPGGSVDIGGACPAGADCVSGLLCAPNGPCASPMVACPPFAGVTCADDGDFRAYFEVPRPGQP